MADRPHDPKLMSFGEHLEELRKRLVVTLVGLFVLFLGGLFVGHALFDLLTQPLMEQLKEAGQPQTLLATSPVEAFGAYIKVALVAAVLVGLPWALFQFWLFLSPGLYPEERRFVYFLLPMSVVLTLLGIAVLYFVLLPISLLFLIRFGAGLGAPDVATQALPAGVELFTGPPLLAIDPVDPPAGSMWINESMQQLRMALSNGEVMGLPLVSSRGIAQQYRISEYINLVFMLGVAFAIAFQVPLVLMLLSWAGIFEPDDLKPYRKHVLFGCAVGSALLPTQDPWSLLILASCLYGLFEFGLILMKVVPASRVARGLGSKGAPTDGDQEA